ncbi:hypothetical protein FOA43_002650 [Brettanomyces nanus]|uniref:Allantoin permease n=1 Tax=Eeniella nana TaxID=13502 RepID=A0A875S6E2_EENNA|nr:uncharacterized protein FOA43_002650 [Brettanomyces nanus]QPG75299.1 hypothetical protein FOA43_002650 [Brettanomyces nanus]
MEVPKDSNAFYDNDSLTNRDIIPIPPERRTWTAFAYATYWAIEGVSISGYTTGSSLVGIGLSVKQSIACSVAAGIIYGIMAVVMGWIGSHHHIGFPLIARFMYGIKGAPFGIVIRITTGIIWWGVQAVYGGEAIRVCLGAMSPSFLTWDTFNNKNGITSSTFVGLFLYCIFMIPCIRIPPEKLQFMFRVVMFITLGAFFGLLGYSVKSAGGAGTMFNAPSTTYKTRSSLAWACVKGIFSIVGTTGTGILGQSDFTRYSKRKHSPVLAQLIGAPVALTFSCVIGIITTSCANDYLGYIQWNPVNLLGDIQQHEHNSSAARAGVFFGGLAFVLQQMAINLLLNTLSSSMDMVGLWPKYINIMRGSTIVMIVGILIWPWKILSSAKAVIIFGSGWGCFCSAQTGIIIAKYYIIYKRKVLLKDLYINSKDSIYWFYHGVDWRSLVAFVIGTVFLMPGLALDVDDKSSSFWTGIYKVSYAWGLFISMGVIISLHLLFPKISVSPVTKVDDVYTDDGTPIAWADESESSEGLVEEVEVHIESKGDTFNYSKLEA